jgi:hypothetical protein
VCVVNQAQWDKVARPIAQNTIAVMGEFLDDPSPQQFPALRRELRAAARCRDIEALRRVTAKLKAEAYNRMLAREAGQRKGTA